MRIGCCLCRFLWFLLVVPLRSLTVVSDFVFFVQESIPHFDYPPQVLDSIILLQKSSSPMTHYWQKDNVPGWQ